MHSYVLRQSLYPTFSFSALTEASLSCLLRPLNRKNDHCESLLALSVSLSLSLYSTGQMWRRDSGEFVMSKCKIRQQSQLSEPEGTRRASTEQIGALLLHTVLQCHRLKCV